MLKKSKLLKYVKYIRATIRKKSSDAKEEKKVEKKGLVLGVYQSDEGHYKLTKHGEKFDAEVGSKISKLLEGSKIKLGNCRVFNNLGEYYGVAVAGLGKQELGVDSNEILNECKENIRTASSVGAKALQKQTVENIMIEEMTNAEAAAEGAILGLWKFQEFVSKASRLTPSKVHLYDQDHADGDSWMKGVIKAQAQNIARRLSEMPANILTPKNLALAAMDYLCPCGITVVIRDREWIREQRMFAFLRIAEGSCEPPYFVEMAYCGGTADDKPIVLTGMGVTFDSGGLCLRPCERFAEFRGSCSGAAVIIGTMKAIAQYKLPINVIGLLPLMENMIGGKAVKPGDVVLAKNGRSIRVEDPSFDGRLGLADALVYSNQFGPCMTTTIGTLTAGARQALGSGASATYTKSDDLWKEIKEAGADTGDRAWRLPLWRHYKKRLTMYPGVDYHNVGYHGHTRGGDSCLAAAFLEAFAPKGVDFVFFDTSGTGMITAGKTSAYYRRGFMTGRPTRTIIQFLKQIAIPNEKFSRC